MLSCIGPVAQSAHAVMGPVAQSAHAVMYCEGSGTCNIMYWAGSTVGTCCHVLRREWNLFYVGQDNSILLLFVILVSIYLFFVLVLYIFPLPSADYTV